MLRKAMWPSAFAVALMVFLGAMGTPNVPAVSAAPGDVCSITADGLELIGDDADQLVIQVGETVDITAYIEDITLHEEDDLDVDLDDKEGDSDITSHDFDGDGDTDDIPDTDFLGDVEIFVNGNVCGDTDEEIEAALAAALEALFTSAAEDAEPCLIEFPLDTTACAFPPVIGDDNDGNDDSGMSFNDADIDCMASNDIAPVLLEVPAIGCAISASASDFDIAAAAAAASILAGDDPAEVGNTVNEALVNSGTDEFIGFQFDDFISDCLSDNIGDDRATSLDGNFTYGGSGACDFIDDFLSDDGEVIVDVTCEQAGTFDLSFSVDDGGTGQIEVICLGEPDAATLTANPTTVEIVPAPGSVAHSLLTLVVTDDDPDDDTNEAFSGFEVDWSTDRCVIEGLTEAQYLTLRPLFAARQSFNPETSEAIDDALTAHGGLSAADTSLTFVFDPPGTGDLQSIAAAVLHCENATNVTPGVATVRATLDEEGPDVTATATVTVVGPPAFITATAAPTSLICGEKATLTIRVTDAIGQAVSDHTVVELVTNFGGVLGGTGGTLGFPGVGAVNPLSSAAAETFQGNAIAYLLTSTQHVGSYEVVAAAGGSLSGAFSTPVVTTQVTVNCSLPAAPVAPTVAAPSTGTGSITPPNTGDAGLASSSSNGMLIVVIGAAAFVLAGIASVSYARR